MLINMKKLILIFIVFISSLIIGQHSVEIPNLKEVRLNKLKEGYMGQPIRFLDDNSLSVKGVLLDVTKNNIIISERGVSKPYGHKNISSVFVDPKPSDLFIVFGLGVVGALGGYLTVIVGHPNPDANMKGVVSSIAAAATSLWGYRSFYKPIRVDVSRKTLIE